MGLPPRLVMTLRYHSRVPSVKSLIKKFGNAARRCHLAGFDVLDVHAAHGYLIHSFLSPLSNFRNDEYGGTQSNRNRFAIEIAQEIRKYWPKGKPLFFRLSCIDRFPGGGGWIWTTLLN